MIKSWSDWVVKHPRSVVVMVLLVIAILATQLPNLKFDTSTRGYLDTTHDSIVIYDRYRDEFGRDEFISIAIQSNNLFSDEFFVFLNQLQAALFQRLPYIDEVDSLITARHIYGEDDELVVEDLFEGYFELPPHERIEALHIIKKTVEENPTYQRLLISDDRTMTAIVLRFQLEVQDEETGHWRYLAEEDYAKIIPIIHTVLDEYENDHVVYSVAGPPIMVSNLEIAMMQDMKTFTSLTIIIIALFLFILFRTWVAVLVPLISVVLSLLATIAAMSITGQPLQVPTVILPSFILAVGIGDAVHLLTMFHKYQNEGNDRDSSLKKALDHTFIPMLLTSLTTAAGLFSFSQTDLVPIANLGMFSALGVLVAFLFTVTLLPASLVLFSESRASTDASTQKLTWFVRFSHGCFQLATKRPGRVITTVFVLVILSLWSASQLHFSHNPMLWIPDHWPVRQATTVIDEKLSGTVAVEMILDSGKTNGLYDAEFMKSVDAIVKEIQLIQEQNVQVRKVLSVAAMLKETERALNNNQEDAYRIPITNELVAQELFLLELSGADDLFNLVDREYRKSRISITAPFVDTSHYQDLIVKVEAIAKRHLPQAEITTTGIIPIFGSTLNEVIHATAKSYLLAFCIITLMMMVLLKSIRYGLVAMVPNLSPIILVMGLLYVIGAPLDMFTMLIASIAIGLSVDDTVHFMYHYRQYRLNGIDNENAIKLTLENSGRAMMITTAVLALGFFVFMASAMNNLFYFGLLTGLTILLALLADFIIAPALLTKLHGMIHK